MACPSNTAPVVLYEYAKLRPDNKNMISHFWLRGHLIVKFAIRTQTMANSERVDHQVHGGFHLRFSSRKDWSSTSTSKCLDGGRPAFMRLIKGLSQPLYFLLPFTRPFLLTENKSFIQLWQHVSHIKTCKISRIDLIPRFTLPGKSFLQSTWQIGWLKRETWKTGTCMTICSIFLNSPAINAPPGTGWSAWLRRRPRFNVSMMNNAHKDRGHLAHKWLQYLILAKMEV